MGQGMVQEQGHLHILGIAGTFMSALALLARALGFRVTGSDTNCYPPVSDLLIDHGIQWTEGYDDVRMALAADCVIVGNAIKRGMPVMEAVLNANKPYISGPQWLAEHVLNRYRVIAVAGTHGKTTTTAMLTHILNCAGLEPGFLIGGVAPNLNTSAKLGLGDWFVIEADEYDSAYFDKRPKLMHYHPEVAILNNLEFDHADIYPNLQAIQQQFHYYLRTIPSKGWVIKPQHDRHLNEVLTQGLYSQLEEFGLDSDATWRAQLIDSSGSAFFVVHQGQKVAEVHWNLIGQFNVENALAAMAASHKAGVSATLAAEALSSFTPIKRRLEVKASEQGVVIYDDFAHHPTAIRKTIDALKASGRHQRIFVVMEFASYTMRTGVHQETLEAALSGVEAVYMLKPDGFDLTSLAQSWQFPHFILDSVDEIVEHVIPILCPGDAVLVMSNRGFASIHALLTHRLKDLVLT